ncbi:MAG: phosphoribosylpyrophosphate synthetase [bacterium (Candidatus Ratteibacteria) CG_4_9_14_3_um_filter_41_21]|uniref:Ribose-phosphate pyrophosphokinase n=1 Tax=bacterium (Candidatus Ratteibacteria) CG_4_9_14_3_um_filter_41_21 TaxID=2014289 RepID=A0A2M7YGW7_9BACT|nr:MAG: phosphoribosylpyrophosphate synthetase [bacterium (Candidatus Ratteibacteria) CG_4_8_14_3_um_filter_41_36]PJA62223.1 MAG: phosphoribosylpyrophosphate synthetase [bacterium (Candidatus Ratteibacteria) CG_4_9_14_3_um_filter_41_21]
MNQCKIFAGNSNPQLTKKICRYLKIPSGKIKVRRFPDGEVSVKIGENVRGQDVFILQSISSPVNESLMEFLVMIDACRRASARRITAVLPYYGYARQDWKDQPRVPITAKLVANLITAAGANRVLTMDLHSPQIQGFFDIPVDHLFAAPVLIKYFQQLGLSNLVVVAPDVGGIKAARAFAKRLCASLAVVDKRRDSPDSVEVMNIIGEIEGRNVVIVDDLIATGRTLCEAAAVLKENGAKNIYASITHGVLSGKSIENIAQSVLRKLIITDTLPLTKEKQLKRIEVLSVASLLGEAIRCIHLEKSVSSLFI